ncbi:uncharacterized protein LOC111698081 [Eurytemora carolleeae]|uniref:uncharacterized protein LOC111698081 n=1 Tax=Eurytemora carolleeae TaxID=1294199 RepID=UPI000C756AC5|nr:uncharacterized protein LOC111698081 [Eurytemora carolleeae]|eukprot:XP_023324086.1 uncharacterized protein LOC111698081 [Eurytemora affinis]
MKKKRRLFEKNQKRGRTADIHPELTLDQIQNPPDTRRGVLKSIGSRSSRSSRRSSELSFTINESLELNTMYEYGQSRANNRRSRPRRREERRSTWTWEAGARRSSVAVMALHVRKNEKRHKKYFSKSVALKPQSRSAVHYLAISPPRIRITDTSREHSPKEDFLSAAQLEKATSNPDIFSSHARRRYERRKSGLGFGQNQQLFSSNESLASSIQDYSYSEKHSGRLSKHSSTSLSHLELDSRRSSGEAFLPNNTYQDEEKVVGWKSDPRIQDLARSGKEGSSSSSSGQRQSISSSNRHFSQESRISSGQCSSSYSFKNSSRSNSSASSAYLLDYGSESKPVSIDRSSVFSSMEADSRRSSAEFSSTNQNFPTFMKNFENMSPISEISSCSSQKTSQAKDRKVPLSLQLSQQPNKISRRLSPKVESSLLKPRSHSPALSPSKFSGSFISPSKNLSGKHLWIKRRFDPVSSPLSSRESRLESGVEPGSGIRSSYSVDGQEKVLLCRCEEKIEKFHDHSLASSFPALHSQFKISLKKSLVRMDRLSIPTPNRSGFRDISRRGLKIVSPKSDPGLRGEISPSGSRCRFCSCPSPWFQDFRSEGANKKNFIPGGERKDELNYQDFF